MIRGKNLAIVLMMGLLLQGSDALSFDYTWSDYRNPFIQTVRVPLYTSGTSTVSLSLPQDILNTSESLTLHFDLESQITLKIDGLERKTFEKWSAYCSVNGALLFGKHRIHVNDLPGRQTSSISVRTKHLKAGRNTLTFSMAPSGSSVIWSCERGKTCIAYDIHKIWFSEFSGHRQESRAAKGRAAPDAKSKPYDVWLVKSVSTSQLDSGGNKCGEATATLYVQGNVAKGTGITSWGRNFEVSGSVDSNGRVDVGIVLGNDIFGTFTGIISGDTANGIWQDKYQCYGTWTATKKIERSRRQGGSDIETKLIELKYLLDKGLITQDDYDRKKAELLNQL